jgi:hypothetical protein
MVSRELELFPTLHLASHKHYHEFVQMRVARVHFGLNYRPFPDDDFDDLLTLKIEPFWMYVCLNEVRSKGQLGRHREDI